MAELRKEEEEEKEEKEAGVEIANERCFELYRLSPSKANLLLTYCACSPFLSLIAELLMLKDVVTLLTVLTKRHEGTLQELSFVPPGMGFLKRLLRMSALVIKPFRDSSQNQDCYDDMSDSTFYNTFDRAKVLHRRTCTVVCTATNEQEGSLTRRTLERLGTLVTHFPCEFPSSSAEYQDGDVSITLTALPKTKLHFEVEFSLTGDPLPFTLQLSCLKCNRHNMISVLRCQVCDKGSRLAACSMCTNSKCSLCGARACVQCFNGFDECVSCGSKLCSNCSEGILGEGGQCEFCAEQDEGLFGDEEFSGDEGGPYFPF